MQLRGERIGRSTNKAFAMPWEVCFNVAYPPHDCKNVYRKQEGNGRRMRRSCPFVSEGNEI